MPPTTSNPRPSAKAKPAVKAQPDAPANASTPFVRRLVDLVVMDWPGTSPRRMFGTDTWFAHGNIFALLDDDDGAPRVGVKLLDADYRVGMALPGARPFMPGGESSKDWVVLPAATCAVEETLEPWLRKAYDAARARAPKTLKNRGRAWLES